MRLTDATLKEKRQRAIDLANKMVAEPSYVPTVDERTTILMALTAYGLMCTKAMKEPTPCK